MPIKVAIVDDHPLAINGIRTMLSAHPQVYVCAAYHSGKSLLEDIGKDRPDVLLLDIQLQDMSGKDLAPLLAHRYPMTRIIALTSFDAPAMIKTMMQKGCLGYLLKDVDDETLVAAIEQVHAGNEFIEPSLKELLLQFVIKNKKPQTDLVKQLTRREKEILKLIVSEHTTQEIADQLFISFRTVENHRYSLLQKLGVKNTAGLVRMALTMGLAE